MFFHLFLFILLLNFPYLIQSYPKGCNGKICSKEVCHMFNPMDWCFPEDSEYECDWHMCEHSCKFTDVVIDNGCLERNNCGQQKGCKITFYNYKPLSPSYCGKWARCAVDHNCIHYNLDCHCPPFSAHVESATRKKKQKTEHHDEL